MPLLPRWITTFVGSLPRRLQYRTRAGAVENWRETTASTIPKPLAWSARLAPSITESPMPRRPALIDPRADGGVSAAVVRSATMAARSSVGRGIPRGYATTGREGPHGEGDRGHDHLGRRVRRRPARQRGPAVPGRGGPPGHGIHASDDQRDGRGPHGKAGVRDGGSGLVRRQLRAPGADLRPDP